jgi:hypothetical protein
MSKLQSLLDQVSDSNLLDLQNRFLLLKYFTDTGGNILLKEFQNPTPRSFLPNNVISLTVDLTKRINDVLTTDEEVKIEKWFQTVTHFARELLEVIIRNIGSLDNKSLSKSLKETAKTLIEKSFYLELEAKLFPTEDEDSDPPEASVA